MSSNQSITLHYTDERDRSYGVAAMALSLVVTEDMPPFDAVSIDAPVGDALMLDAAALVQNMRGSDVSTAFRRRLREFELGMRAMLSNVVARSVILHNSGPAQQVYDLLYKEMHDYGVNDCALEDDEVRRLAEQEYNYVRKIFNHPSVPAILSRLADTLATRRVLTRREVQELVSVR